MSVQPGRTRHVIPREWGIAALAILALNALVWGRTVGHGFVFDDYINILQNAWIRDWRILPAAFSHQAAGFSAGYDTSFYRPMMHVFYALAYAIAGARPWAFHLLNVVLATACAGGVYWLTVLVRDRYFAGDRGRWMPLATALVFTVHPIHTEAVAWSAGITDLSYTLFGLLALALYVRRIERGPSAWPGILLFLSLLSKETGAAVLLLFVVVEWIEAHRDSGWTAGAALSRLLPPLAFVAADLALRFWALGGFAPSASAHPHTAVELVGAGAGLFARYLFALVAPLEMNIMRDVPLDAGLSDPAALIGLLLLAMLGVLVWKARRAPLATLAMAVAVLPILPATCVPAIEGGLTVFGERYLFLPVLGVAWGIGWLIAAGRAHGRKAESAAFALVAALILFGAVVSASRAGVWADSVTLWTDAIEKAPRVPAAHESLCHALMLENRPQDALAACDRALALDAGRVEARTNRASLLLSLGRAGEAERELETVLRARYNSAPAHTLLGLARMTLGRPNEALASYRQAIAIDPAYAEAHNDLGVALARAGRIAEARVEFDEAVRLAPDDPEYRANLDASRR